MAWRWSEAKTSGRVPEPRAGVASSVQDGSLVLLGGWDGKTAFNDAYTVGLSDFRWRMLKLRGDGTMADRIMFGTAADEDGVIYVHGGCRPDNLNDMYHDVMAFDARTSKLRTIKTVGDWTGDGPGYIIRQSVAVVGGYLYVFGGWDNKKWLDATFRLDLDAENKGGAKGSGAARWERLATRGFIPYGRTHACLVPWPLPTPRLLLYGGGDVDTDFSATYSLDARSWYWERLYNVSNATVALSQMACGVLPMAGSDELALAVHGGFGGVPEGQGERGDRQSALRLLRFGRTEWRWTVPQAVHGSSQGRLGHVMQVVNASCLVVWGGSIGLGGKHRNDLLVAVPNRLAASQDGEDDGKGDDGDGDDGEAEEDGEAEKGAEGAGGKEEEDEWYEEDERATPPPPAPRSGQARAQGDHEGLNGASETPIENWEVIRTVRTADKKEKKRTKAKKRRPARSAKDEL